LSSSLPPFANAAVPSIPLGVAKHDAKLAAAVAAAAEIVKRKRRTNKEAGSEVTLSRFSDVKQDELLANAGAEGVPGSGVSSSSVGKSSENTATTTGTVVNRTRGDKPGDGSIAEKEVERTKDENSR
jgi:hypothetical protein